MLKFSSTVIWRLGTRSTLRKYSSTGAAVFKTDKIDTKGLTSNNTKSTVDDDKDSSVYGSLRSVSVPTLGKRNNVLFNKQLRNYVYSEDYRLVAAAFASLNSPESDDQRKPSPKSVKQNRQQLLDTQILKATDVNSLLVVAEQPIVSRRHALKMVSILSEWSSSNKVKLSDFEKDPRFLKLCRILARTPSSQTMSSLTMAEDLSTVLGITGDDEAARLIMNLSLPQMIKVMKALNQKGRRSTPLLRALSHNITKQSDIIDLKKSADLLYCMAALNFPDPVLLDRICNDVIECLPSNQDKPAVVNSILVSLGLLKYRHEVCLTGLVDWLQKHKDIWRVSDVASAVVTLATLDFVPPHSEVLFEWAVALKEEEMVKSSMWLDLVFSLLIVNKATQHHLASTLKPEFIDKLLSAGEIPIPARRKLMAIDAWVGLTAPSSARLPEDVSVGVPVVYTKEKASYVHSILDTFKSLVSADTFFRRDCNSGMGFLYDAEFAVDAKCHPVPLEKADKNKNIFRIAVLGLDYHDMTRKTTVPLGVNQLYTRLLQLKGYKVLQIPYTEFNPKEKLVTRVQYIEKKLKELIKAV